MNLIKYAVVGSVSTLIHYSFLIVFVEFLHFSVPFSAGLAALYGAFVGYFGNRHFTFHSLNAHRFAFPRFLIIAAIGALLNSSFVWLTIHFLGIHYLLAQVFATGLMLLLTYEINKNWTFQP